MRHFSATLAPVSFRTLLSIGMAAFAMLGDAQTCPVKGAAYNTAGWPQGSTI